MSGAGPKLRFCPESNDLLVGGNKQGCGRSVLLLERDRGVVPAACAASKCSTCHVEVPMHGQRGT